MKAMQGRRIDPKTMYLSGDQVRFEPRKGRAWLEHLGRVVEVRVVAGRSAYRYRAVWRDGAVVLTTPRRASEASVVEALRSLGAQLVVKEREWREAEAMRRGSELHYLGQPLKLSWTVEGLKAGAEMTSEGLWVWGVRGQEEAEKLASFWLVQAAHQKLTTQCLIAASQLGTTVTKVVIRDQKSRWGSCSSRGTISLNWRLIMAPEEVIHYMLVHELAHRFEMNHGPRFWLKVDRHCPDWKRWDRWLGKEGPRLMTRLPRVNMAQALSADLGRKGDSPYPLTEAEGSPFEAENPSRPAGGEGQLGLDFGL
jgi:predicted metal-dependent hydrolase